MTKNCNKIFQNLILIILILITLTSCSGNGTITPESPGLYIYYEVPYVSQPVGSELCGVASSIMVLNYYGENLSMNTFGPTITGTDGKVDLNKIEIYLNDNGYNHIDVIINVLERGPFMVTQKYSLTDDTKHHRVFIGYDNNKEEIITHDPLRGKNFKISYDDFFAISINSKCWCFEIRPENKGEKDTKIY
jgi:uncharacterized protein YvpB